MTLELIDSHAHLCLPDFDLDRTKVIEKAFQNGIKAILCPLDIASVKEIKEGMDLKKSSSQIFLTAGLHPHKGELLSPEHLKNIQRLAQNKDIIAVGEIGLDFHYNFSSPGKQKEALRKQLILAETLRLPVIIHSRMSGKEITAIIIEEKFSQGGILHCFTEDLDFALKMIEHGFLISFSGILTFPRAQSLRETARKLPLNKLLLETDSPYLVPVPFRGRMKRNEPFLVKETAKTLAQLKNLSLQELAEKTTHNFLTFFNV